MLRARLFEDKVAAMYRAGKIKGGVYLGRGQEAFSGALGFALDRQKGDVFAGLIRDQAGRMAFGEPTIDAAQAYFGSSLGPMRGRDGNIHRGRPAEGMPAMISHLGASISVVNGMLMAKRFRGESGYVGGAAAGDGATSTGAFHEGLNQAAVEKLPLVIGVADNQFAYSTATDRQFACEDLADRAAGYGVEGYSIDGTDMLECLSTFQNAVERARAGHGPQLVVGKLLRLSGHGEHDDASYVPQSARESRYGRDCMVVARATLLEKGLSDEASLSEMESSIQQEIEESISQAQSEPSPDPAKDDWRCLSEDRLVDGSIQSSH
ncbi:MAG: pyruvate dehydrogenase [Verrucomicrobiales bacterium]|nr:pyruvate dehydrogenase [Verrucomicrobiales bacterium]